jgi:hypothetical protein
VSNTRGSKSARTPKIATTPATVDAPAVTPTPTDTLPPKPAGRKRKPEPTVATKTEVPAWAKRAAAHDTAAEMAAVPEAAPEAEAPPTPKRRRAAKPEPTPAAAATAKAGSLRAIGNGWIEAIRANGASVSTVSSYSNDLEVAYGFLDGDAPAGGITEKQIASFDKCKAVLTKKNGKPKAQPTILKTRRALRLALTWAAEAKLIKSAPYPAA